MSSTIAAIASSAGAGRRAVLRVSGPRAARLGAECCTDASGRPLKLDRRGAHEGLFDDGVGALPCLAVWMPGPRSFTAEDVLELHLPGHPALAQGALERVLSAGATLAEPGEFTRRAFENGRIDLTRAEGVLALVQARTRSERRAASALLAGGLERRLGELRAGLEALRSLTEASLDFDEADTGHVPTQQLERMASDVAAGLDAALGWERARMATGRAGRAVLAGAPNAGKSTLFNRLASGRTAEASGGALVSDLAGTTRDAKHAEWRLSPDRILELVDTAGVVDRDGARGVGASDVAALGRRGEGGAANELGPAGRDTAGRDTAERDTAERATAERKTDERDADDPDRIAESNAARLVSSADLLVTVVDAAGAALPSLEAEGAPVLLVWNKTDLKGAAPEPPWGLRERADAWVAISAASGDGLEALDRAALALLESNEDAAGNPGALGLGARHLQSLEEARAGLQMARQGLLGGESGGGAPLDQVAEDLRCATDALDGVVGRTTPEDLLDRIFAQFCLGK